MVLVRALAPHHIKIRICGDPADGVCSCTQQHHAAQRPLSDDFVDLLHLPERARKLLDCAHLLLPNRHVHHLLCRFSPGQQAVLVSREAHWSGPGFTRPHVENHAVASDNSGAVAGAVAGLHLDKSRSRGQSSSECA